MALHRSRRDGTVGPATRPVAIPDDLDGSGAEKVSGLVELPSHIRWSHPKRIYDLSDRRDRALVYEQVLTEGTAHDVQRYIDVATLVDLWPELVLPTHVRRAWADWLRAHLGLELSC